MQHTNTFLYLVKTQASQLNINITIKFSQSSTKKKKMFKAQLNSNMIRLAYFNSKFYNWKSKFVCRREPKFWNPNFELKILCSCLTTPPFFPKLGPALLVSCKQKENAGEHAFISCISQTKNQKQHHGRLSFLQLTKREEHANVTSSKKGPFFVFSLSSGQTTFRSTTPPIQNLKTREVPE